MSNSEQLANQQFILRIPEEIQSSDKSEHSIGLTESAIDTTGPPAANSFNKRICAPGDRLGFLLDSPTLRFLEIPGRLGSSEPFAPKSAD